MTIPDPLHLIDPLKGVNQQPSPASRPPEAPEANIPSPGALSEEEVCQVYAKSAQALHAIPILATLRCCSEGPLKEFDMNAFFAYHRRTLEAAGAPTDSIEVMMIEQILLANQRLVTLQRLAMKAQSLQETEVYNTQANRLMAEFRKTAAGLQEYRNARAPRQVIVQQQNYAAGNQQVALLDGTGMLAGEHLLGGKKSLPTTN